MSGQDQETPSKSTPVDTQGSAQSSTIDFGEQLAIEGHPQDMKYESAATALNDLPIASVISAADSMEADNTEIRSTRREGDPASVYVDPSAAEAEDGDGKVMSVVDHLDELRNRLIRTLIVFVVAMAVTFSFGKEIIQFLEKPAGKMTFQALSIEEPLLVYCKVAFYAALVLVAPYILFEISAFVAPGLRRNERKLIAPIVLGGPLLFVAGAAFCYFLVLPPMLGFFTSFGVGISPVQQRLDFYISLVTTMLFYMGICFQLPIVLFALSLAGIVNSKQLMAVWRYAVVGSSVAAAIITPDPTFISMVIVWAALLGLYFFTIGLLKIFGR
ncbi:MAG: twin-arginine translocase subunit TatC [Candidatus Obscuribacterales bacterium]|nr:twin-arginine translocase subunit TatC [Candidatus Obscuribacterales bacterium]